MATTTVTKTCAVLGITYTARTRSAPRQVLARYASSEARIERRGSTDSDLTSSAQDAEAYWATFLKHMRDTYGSQSTTTATISSTNSDAGSSRPYRSNAPSPSVSQTF
jgi:hypothetical protein